MIGRARELTAILDLCDAMIGSRHTRNVVFVTGEAGAGKTTLMRKVGEKLAKRSGEVLVVSTECSTPLMGQDVGQAEALEPWAELLEDILRNAHDDGTARKNDMIKLVSSVAIAWTHAVPFIGGVLHSSIETAVVMREHRQHAQEDPASQEQMFQQYINFLGKASEQRPIVLVLDDFHWADTSSTNLLFTAARRLAGKRVIFLIAYRADDALSSRGGAGHPLLHVKNELGRYSQTVDVVVPRMEPTDVESLLRARYPRYQDSRTFERWLTERSGGNALFITQYLNTLEEDGILNRQTGELKDHFDAVRVPTSAASVVEERIRRLDDDARELLRYASVEGATFTAAVLTSLTDLKRLELLARLRLLAERHGVIMSLGKQRVYASESTAYQFTNVLMQRVLYESLEQEERELLHARVFEAIKRDHEGASSEATIVGLAVRLAAHAATPADRLLAARLLLEAARASWGRRAEEETLAILANLGRQLEALGAARLAGDTPAGRELNELAAGSQLVAGKVHKFRGRFPQAIACFRAARARFDAGDRRALEPLMREAFSLENAGRYPEAEALSKEALARAEEHGDDRVRGAMLNNLGLAATAQGRIDEGLAHQQASLELREKIGDRVGQTVSLGSMGLALSKAGRVDEALATHRRALALREELGARVGQGYSMTNIGNLLAAAGRLEEALDYHRRAVAVREACGDVVKQAESLGNEARLLLRLERVDEAADRLAQALRLRETLGDPRAEATTAIELAALLPEDKRRRPLERALRLCGDLADEQLAEQVRAQLAGLPPAPPEPALSEDAPLLDAEPARLERAREKGMAWLARAVLWVYEKVEDR